MHRGWIATYRRLFESDMWLAEPFTRGQAWVDLVGLANYKPGWIRKRGIKMEIPRGGVGWSEVSLAERWQWSRGKVRRFFDELKTEQQIVQQKNNVSSCILIVNYERYQGDGTANSTADGQQTVQQTVPEQEGQEGKKNKKESKARAARFAPPSLAEVLSYSAETGQGSNGTPEAFHDHFTSNGWKVGGKAPMKDWQASYRGWCRRDTKRTEKRDPKLPAWMYDE